jgi:hypothetical protein
MSDCHASGMDPPASPIKEETKIAAGLIRLPRGRTKAFSTNSGLSFETLIACLSCTMNYWIRAQGGMIGSVWIVCALLLRAASAHAVMLSWR